LNGKEAELARPTKSEAREDTRGELIEAAWRLFSTEGYDATPVEAILEIVGLSKGTFYYYFTGKEDILDAVVSHIVDEMALGIKDIPNMKNLSPMQKMNLFMETTSNWKLANIDIISEAIKVLYRDENAIILHKMNMRTLQEFAPALTEIIKQGVEEGTFDVEYPRDTAEMILLLSRAMGDQQAEDMLHLEDDPGSMQRIVRRVRLYLDAMERILGASRGSIFALDDGMVQKFEQALKGEGVRENGA
jgi:AcrR family transcriptional regulator